MKPHLEDVYEALARAIDAVGREKETIFLAKVALLLAERLDDPASACALVEAALVDLDAMEV